MTILVLAGTSEGRRVAKQLHEQGTDVLASLAGATRDPRSLGVPKRIGGFGGAAGFSDVMTACKIRAVIDATHPFAQRIGPRSAAICAELGIPYLRLLRPEWKAEPGDQWHDVATEDEAARRVPVDATVFLATGAKRLSDLFELRAQKVVLRVADPPCGPLPWRNVDVIVGAPGPADTERSLFQKHGITWMIARNSGGLAHGKLGAARGLGIEVAMIARPARPDAPIVERVPEALAWAKAL